jgi:hypothetical protein
MTNNNEFRGRLKGFHRAQDVLDQGKTGDAVHDLRKGGLHARALARGEHQDVKIRHADVRVSGEL